MRALKFNPASRPQMRTASAANSALSAFTFALMAFRAHTRDILAPAEKAVAKSANLPANYLLIESANTDLFNALADAEDALMIHPGNRPEDAYARLVGLWSAVSRSCIDRHGEHCGCATMTEAQTRAIRLSLDAVAGMIGRPGAAHYQFYQ